MKSNLRSQLLSLCGLLALAVHLQADQAIVYLNQGWAASDRANFYHLAEGSELVPIWVIKNLTSASTGKPFLDQPERFGAIADPTNDDNLPIGFTSALSRDASIGPLGGPMVGISCAACHTEEISYQNTRYRIEGGPGKFDLISYYGDLGASLKKTLEDPLEFVKFLSRVAHFNIFESKSSSLAPLGLMNFSNKPSDTDNIVQQLEQNGNAKAIEDEVSALNANPPPQEPVPFKRVPEADVIQIQHSNAALLKLNTIVKNKLGGGTTAIQLKTNLDEYRKGYVLQFATKDTAKTYWTLLYRRLGLIVELGRAAGKGVEDPGAGRIDAFDGARDLMFNESVKQDGPVKYPHLWGFSSINWIHYDGNTTSVVERNIGQALGLGAIYDPNSGQSTVIVRNLHSLEMTAAKLTPPPWPAALGKLDQSLVSRGAQIFAANCASCHNESSDPPLLKLADIGTDPTRALNFAEMDGNVAFVDKLADSLHRIRLAAYVDANLTPAEIAEFERGRPNNWRATSSYSARSLKGIWASAPYLHNGSVPTLDDLLTSQELRPKQFFITSRLYDPIKVGFDTSKPDPAFNADPNSPPPKFDTTVTGNGNYGHSGPKFGTTLSDADKKALLEYLKSL